MNEERQLYENATKKQKAQHNGVDVSRWDNTCPRIAVPEGWEDHQHTQQLIRKYMNNDFIFLNIATGEALVYVTQREAELCRNGIEHTDQGWVHIYQYINETFKGFCLEIHPREFSDSSEIKEEGRIRSDGSVRNSFIKRVYFMKTNKKGEVIFLKNDEQFSIKKSIVEKIFIKNKSETFCGLSDYGWRDLLKREGVKNAKF